MKQHPFHDAEILTARTTVKRLLLLATRGPLGERTIVFLTEEEQKKGLQSDLQAPEPIHNPTALL